MKLGERISEYRQNRNMTQEELAAKLGVTPQAVSKWERGASSPDIGIVTELCTSLGVSADSLLGLDAERTTRGKFSLNDCVGSEAVWETMRSIDEPVSLYFGEEIAEKVFVADTEERHLEFLKEQRRVLALSGMILPIVRFCDAPKLAPREFWILAYRNVLYREVLETIDGQTTAYLIEKLGRVIEENYACVLNRELVRLWVENLKQDYPAVVEGVVPELISYALLQKVLIGLLERGDDMCDRIRTIETLEDELRKNPQSSACELVAAVAAVIEREDSYWSMMSLRENGES